MNRLTNLNDHALIYSQELHMQLELLDAAISKAEFEFRALSDHDGMSRVILKHGDLISE
jgi:hypothetical protein